MSIGSDIDPRAKDPRWLQYLQKQQEYIANAIEKIKQLLGETSAANETSSRDRVICNVSLWGIVACEKESSIATSFLSGHWTNENKWATDSFYWGQGYEILILVDQMTAEFLKDRPDVQNTVTMCEGTDSFVMNTFGPDAADVASSTPSALRDDLPSISEMAGMKAGCELLRNMASPAPGTASGATFPGLSSSSASNDWVSEEVAKADKTINDWYKACKADEEKLGPISSIWLRIGWEVLKQVSYNVIGGIIVEIIFSPKNTSSVNDDDRNRREAASATAEAEAAKGRAGEAVIAAILALDSLDKITASANEDGEVTADEQRKIDEAKRKFDEAKKKADEAQKKAEEAQKKADEKNKKLNPTPAPKPTTAPPNTENPGETGFEYSCEARQLRWENFKNECYKYDLWDKCFSECNEFLRRQNGCFLADPRVMLPVEELDCACHRPGASIEFLWSKDCEEMKKRAQPIGDAPIVCPRPPLIQLRGPDCCSNPACDPAPGVCEDPIPQSTPNPNPSPVNIFQSGNTQIYDALGLDFLGIGAP